MNITSITIQTHDGQDLTITRCPMGARVTKGDQVICQVRRGMEYDGDRRQQAEAVATHIFGFDRITRPSGFEVLDRPGCSKDEIEDVRRTIEEIAGC